MRIYEGNKRRINLKNFNNAKVTIQNYEIFCLEKLGTERVQEKKTEMALSFDREVPRNAGTKLNEGTEMKKSSERRGVAWHQF